MPSAAINQSSSKYASDAAKKLKMSEYFVQCCQQTADNISKLEVLTGKKPATIAGVAIWIIVKRCPSLKQTIPSLQIVSEVLGMSEPAVKSAYKEVEIVEEEVIPIGFKGH